jgi:hypothetical protein
MMAKHWGDEYTDQVPESYLFKKGDEEANGVFEKENLSFLDE